MCTIETSTYGPVTVISNGTVTVMMARSSGTTVAAAPAAPETRGGALSPMPPPLPLPQPGTRGGARSPPPSPTPSGTSVAAAPAAYASRDNVSFSCPDRGFWIASQGGRWVVAAWAASPGRARPTRSDPLGRARGGKKITRVWRTMPALVPERDRRSVSTRRPSHLLRQVKLEVQVCAVQVTGT